MKKLTRRQTLSFAVAPFAASIGLPARAQAFPSKQVTIVVGYPAGGDSDALARAYGEKLALRLGQPVVVDNRPGASGTIGAAFVAKAPADGHTLLLVPSTFAMAQLVLKPGSGAAHDVVNDFTPIMLTGRVPLMLVASQQSGYKDVAGVVAAAKAGKKLSYASPGAGSPMHVLGEMFNRAAGVQIAHNPYRGIAPAVTDILGEHIELMWTTPGPIGQHIQSGRIVPIAFAEPRRYAPYPNVPTFAEVGYSNVELGAWHGLLGPKGLPTPVVQTLNNHMNEILKMPDVLQRMAFFASTPVGGEPVLLAREIANDDRRLRRIIADLKIQVD